ncbi:hypothetical protein PAHAL_2G418600 [Panicum hallii]|uniref:SGNH hydrolase-type esterase domain-containing protein n=1 Tax=Panicum hallii TaxID=206008 RepID=A0A2S3H3C0_9POAL|nr:hypothetical protein PAHAL_2G418600 [Panicum hallii]
MESLFAAACFAFLLLNAAGVESRRCRCDGDGDDYDSDKPSYDKLFVFGDSFADAGNLPKGDLKWETRGWYAKIILGQKEAPPPERLRRHDGVDLSSGVNFANSGSGVFPGWNLDKQIKKFKRLLRKRIIGKDLSQSVALVSIASCADYADVPSDLPDMDPLYISNVTDGIVDGVRKLQDLGVGIVLVNLLPPLGCAPLNTRADNYARCEKDKITGVHNKHLTQKLRDLMTTRSSCSTSTPSSKASSLPRPACPCCESIDENGFCGQVDGEGNLQYTLCDRPYTYFYWDTTNPTQAGWKAVMEQLEGPIREYLGI